MHSMLVSLPRVLQALCLWGCPSIPPLTDSTLKQPLLCSKRETGSSRPKSKTQGRIFLGVPRVFYKQNVSMAYFGSLSAF